MSCVFSFDKIIPRKYHRIFRTTFQDVSRRPFSRRLSYHPRPLSNHRPSFATTTFSVPPQRRRVTLSGASLQIQSATTRSAAPHRQRGKCQTLRPQKRPAAHKSSPAVAPAAVRAFSPDRRRIQKHNRLIINVLNFQSLRQRPKSGCGAELQKCLS